MEIYNGINCTWWFPAPQLLILWRWPPSSMSSSRSSSTAARECCQHLGPSLAPAGTSSRGRIQRMVQVGKQLPWNVKKSLYSWPIVLWMNKVLFKSIVMIVRCKHCKNRFLEQLCQANLLITTLKIEPGWTLLKDSMKTGKLHCHDVTFELKLLVVK